MAWKRVGQGGRNETPATQTTSPRFRASKPGLEHVSFKTGTPTAAILLIKNTNAPTRMETQQLWGVSTASKVLAQIEEQARPTKPTLKIDDDKWTYATKMIDYEALMELYLYYRQLKKDEHGEPVLATMTTPANTKCEATGMNNYYRVLGHNKPADNDKEPTYETMYDESFGNDVLEYDETTHEQKANNLTAAARNKHDKAFAQTRATDDGEKKMTKRRRHRKSRRGEKRRRRRSWRQRERRRTQSQRRQEAQWRQRRRRRRRRSWRRQQKPWRRRRRRRSQRRREKHRTQSRRRQAPQQRHRRRRLRQRTKGRRGRHQQQPRGISRLRSFSATNGSSRIRRKRGDDMHLSTPTFMEITWRVLSCIKGSWSHRMHLSLSRNKKGRPRQVDTQQRQLH